MNSLAVTGLICATLFANCGARDLGNEEEWQAFKSLYKKDYKKCEEEYRRAIWRANLKKIEEHNKGNHSFTLAMNQLGDLTPIEFRQLMLGTRYRGHRTPSGSAFLPPRNVELPATVDWRTKGYVTPVKDQEQCGSCWAFSVTGSLEGQHFKKTQKLVSLSEQNLVDCSGKFGTSGCNGGYIDDAFKYIKANDGIDTEASYPYTAKNGTCKFKIANVGATCTGYTDIQKGSEADLQSATATVGPISVTINAGHMSFQFYHEGVYNEPRCTAIILNHAVLVVGYGTLGGQDYWLVKNSWGTSWGMKGYIMMSRNKHNQCGIASLASYPLV